MVKAADYDFSQSVSCLLTTTAHSALFSILQQYVGRYQGNEVSVVSLNHSLFGSRLVLSALNPTTSIKTMFWLDNLLGCQKRRWVAGPFPLITLSDYWLNSQHLVMRWLEFSHSFLLYGIGDWCFSRDVKFQVSVGIHTHTIMDSSMSHLFVVDGHLLLWR